MRFSLIGFAVVILVGSGCFLKKDPCKDVICYNGECVDGECVCEAGYSGPNCSTFDPCYNTTCINGDCVNGTCDCDAGYEGANCGTPINSKFSGVYTLSENCVGAGLRSYAVTVTPSSSSILQAKFTGLYGEAGVILTAIIDPNGTSFSIPLQALNSVKQIESFSGSISADGTLIEVEYAVYSNVTTDNCVATLIK